MSVQAQRYLSLGEVPGLAGNTHPVISPYGVFETADGPLNIAPATAEMWKRLCDVLELQHLVDDPRYATNAARIERRARTQGAHRGEAEGAQPRRVDATRSSPPTSRPAPSTTSPTCSRMNRWSTHGSWRKCSTRSSADPAGGQPDLVRRPSRRVDPPCTAGAGGAHVRGASGIRIRAGGPRSPGSRRRHRAACTGSERMNGDLRTHAGDRGRDRDHHVAPSRAAQPHRPGRPRGAAAPLRGQSAPLLRCGCSFSPAKVKRPSARAIRWARSAHAWIGPSRTCSMPWSRSKSPRCAR